MAIRHALASLEDKTGAGPAVAGLARAGGGTTGTAGALTVHVPEAA